MHIKRINEEIRQHRLYRIQITEAKIKKFSKAHEEIKEHLVIKFTKNATLNLIRLFLWVLFSLFAALSILFFFPDKLIEFIGETDIFLGSGGKEAYYFIAQILAYGFMFFAFVAFYVNVLMKKNIRNRNKLYRMNELLVEMIKYMKEVSTDEKRKYEFYVDNLQEIENRNRQYVNR